MTWALPAVVHPPKTRCFTIQVPDDREYIAAFRGALLALASGYNWADDEAHTAREVALVWWDIVEKVDQCLGPDNSKTPGLVLEDALSTQIRISPDDSCIIQMWCIDHWEDWYDPRDCISTGSGQARSHDGGQPAPGTTQSYCQTINARDGYLYPVQVNAGDIITASQFGGAWTNGRFGLISQWFCPDGSTYGLGYCGGAPTTDSGNPLPAEPDMLLLAFIDGVYYPIGNGTPLIIPAGVTNENMLLVPNTDDMTIASGSVSACVEIQAAQAAPLGATYGAGTGPTQIVSGNTYTFNSDASGNPALDVTFGAAVKITVLTSTLDHPICAGTCGYYTYSNPPGSPFITYSYPPTHPTDVPPTTGIREWQVNSGGGGPTYTITAKIEF